MAKVGKISILKKEYSVGGTSITSSLGAAGYTRFPGTAEIFEVYRENNGSYRTGLDEDAVYIKRMDSASANAEKERVRALREKWERSLAIDLGPRSDYYEKRYDDKLHIRCRTAKLIEGDNIFNLEDPDQALTYAWLRVHPLIAPSYNAYLEGKCPQETHFYVNDEDIEEDIIFKKRTLKNKAIAILENLTLEKRKKVARLLGLPISDDSKEALVYNQIDIYLNQPNIGSGVNKGKSPVDLFLTISGYSDDYINIRDTIVQSITHGVLRERDGKIMEGQRIVSKDIESYIAHLNDLDNQDELLALKEKLNSKKNIAA